MPALLALSGSLRRHSYNTAVLETLVGRWAAKASMAVHHYHELPPYSEDDDKDPALPEVARLRNAIEATDAIVIATPEYNHGLPGSLKNAIDWASRPRGRTCLKGKPVLPITASMATTGGVRAHAQLNEALLSVAARLVLRPQAVIGVVHEKVRDGRLVDGAVLTFLDAALDDLLDMIP